MHTLVELRQTEHLSQLTQTDILDAAEESYIQLADTYKRSIDVAHNSGLCDPASRLMVKYLGAKGHEAARIDRSVPVRHYYVDLASESGEQRVIVDPTWQQFLDDSIDSSDLPKVLIGTRDEIVAAARSYGVVSRFLDLYGPLRSFADDREPWQEPNGYPC